jgi:hypothetical protein
MFRSLIFSLVCFLIGTISAQATTLRIDATGTPPSTGNLGVDSFSISLQFDTSDDRVELGGGQTVPLSFAFGQAVINGSEYNLTRGLLDFANGTATITIGFPSDWAFARVFLQDQRTVFTSSITERLAGAPVFGLALNDLNNSSVFFASVGAASVVTPSDAAVIPLPAGLPLLASGLALFAVMRRTNRRKTG